MKEAHKGNIEKEIEESREVWKRMFDIGRMFYLFRKAQCEVDNHLKSKFFDPETQSFLARKECFIEGRPLPSRMYASEEEARAAEEAWIYRTKEIRNITEYWVKEDGNGILSIIAVHSRIQGMSSTITVDPRSVHDALRMMIERSKRIQEEQADDPLAFVDSLFQSPEILLQRRREEYTLISDPTAGDRLQWSLVNQMFSDNGDTQEIREEYSWLSGEVMREDVSRVLRLENFNWYSELLAQMQNVETYGREHYEEKGFPLAVRRRYLEILKTKGFKVDRRYADSSEKEVNLAYRVSKNGIIYPVIEVVEKSSRVDGISYVFQQGHVEIPMEHVQRLLDIPVPSFSSLTSLATVSEIDEAMRHGKEIFNSWLQEGNNREQLNGLTIHPDMLASKEKDDGISGNITRLDLNTQNGDHVYRVISRKLASDFDNETEEVDIRDEVYTQEDPSLPALRILIGLAY